MKKIFSMVGVGAMVVALGVGSTYAQQQQTTQQAGSSSTVSGQAVPVDAGKNKASTAKPEGDVKAGKADPATHSVGKAKTGSEAKPEIVAPAKPADMKSSGQAKPETVAPVKPSTEKATGNTTSAKPGAEGKAAESADAKAPIETKSSMPTTAKPSGEKPSDKTGDMKPAKQ